jgi:glycosyltransferase involved in cell wall biosynthesis
VAVESSFKEQDQLQQTAHPDISIIIVNWNAKDFLEGCLNSLRSHNHRGLEYEILVVDNNSGDGSTDMLR